MKIYTSPPPIFNSQKEKTVSSNSYQISGYHLCNEERYPEQYINTKMPRKPLKMMKQTKKKEKTS